MSSLRVDTLRLCWLEAFIAVVDEENISEAARSLDLDQSTVSRYMQALEKWLGKKLIEPGSVFDPEDIRLSVGVTPEGRQFYRIAKSLLRRLTKFRHGNAIRDEILGRMDNMISSMEKDLLRKNPLPVTTRVGEYIRRYRALHSDVLKVAPLEFTKIFHRLLIDFFKNYEWERNKGNRRARMKMTPAPYMPDEWFDGRLKEALSSLPAKLSDNQQGEFVDAEHHIRRVQPSELSRGG